MIEAIGMKIRTIVIDEDPMWQELIVRHIQMHADMTLVGVFAAALDAYSFIKDNKVDLILLDVNLPQVSGISFVKGLINPPPIVFISSYTNFAAESYEVSATDFIVKPFNNERFGKMLDKVRLKLAMPEQTTTPQEPDLNPYFFIRENNAYVKIYFADILFIKSLENFVQIFTKKGTHTTLSTLKNLMMMLPENAFMQTHRSYVVRLAAIDTIGKDSLMINEIEVPVSEQFKDKIVKILVETKLLKR